MNYPRLSGWCSPECTPRSHDTCQGRIDKGQLAGCNCLARGGHIGPQLLAITADVRDTGGLTNSAPGGASTPESQGLADYEGVDS